MIKSYFIALAVGLLVGAVYGVVNVRSPAPPVIALVGLLGILAGEQSVPLARRLLSGQPLTPTAAAASREGHQMDSTLSEPRLPAHMNRRGVGSARPPTPFRLTRLTCREENAGPAASASPSFRGAPLWATPSPRQTSS